MTEGSKDSGVPRKAGVSKMERSVIVRKEAKQPKAQARSPADELRGCEQVEAVAVKAGKGQGPRAARKGTSLDKKRAGGGGGGVKEKRGRVKEESAQAPGWNAGLPKHVSAAG